jgi:predicted naringenin-chalcone synthase
MNTLPPRLVALGTALPPGSMTATQYADFAVRMTARVPREAALIHAVVQRSTINTRHSVLAEANEEAIRLPFYEQRAPDQPRIPTTHERMQRYATDAPFLAHRAALGALTRADALPSLVTHLVTASCTGFVAPGIDAQLVHDLHLKPATPRTHIGFMGCHAALNVLAAAGAICLADPTALVLGVTVELCTLHFQPSLHRDDLLPNALFGDAAAAFLLAGSAHPLFDAATWQLDETHSHILPATADLMTWRIGDTGFRMTLDATVPDVIASNLPTLASQWKWHDGPAVAWGIHPGGPRILEAASRALGLRDEKTATSRAVLSRIGNVSSPTVLFILEELMRDPANHDTARLMAFGPGLAVEAAQFNRSR